MLSSARMKAIRPSMWRLGSGLAWATVEVCCAVPGVGMVNGVLSTIAPAIRVAMIAFEDFMMAPLLKKLRLFLLFTSVRHQIERYPPYQNTNATDLLRPIKLGLMVRQPVDEHASETSLD